MRCLILADHVGWNPSALANGHTLRPGPFTNVVSPLPVRRISLPRNTALYAARSASMLDEGRKRLTELFAIGRAQIDLEASAIKAKGNGAVSLAAVYVVHVGNLDLLCHR
jgi:hypothetical protein